MSDMLQPAVGLIHDHGLKFKKSTAYISHHSSGLTA